MRATPRGYGVGMSLPQISLCLPSTAREALEHYRGIFGGEVGLNTFADFGRSDGPGDAIAFGILRGEVTLFAFDAGPDDAALQRMDGVMLTVLGDDAERYTRWFEALSDGGEVLDDLQKRPWGDYDGTVRDRFGVTWLIGHRGSTEGGAPGEPEE